VFFIIKRSNFGDGNVILECFFIRIKMLLDYNMVNKVLFCSNSMKKIKRV